MKDPLLKLVLALSISTMLFSFSSNTENKREAAIAPFKIMLIKHTVANYEKWKPAFDAHSSVRKEYGQTDLDLLREIDNPNQLLIVQKISDVQKAKAFTVLPDLKETMEKARVTSAPEFFYYNVVRNEDSKINTKERIMVTHKVKDFDAWVKVYDGEGKATRASEGMVDRVLARGIDDPNIVHIVFAVTDMVKAKAAINSEAKKKLMKSAGVEGVPTIEFYKQAK
jgi:quinol monooxygenase YgiN